MFFVKFVSHLHFGGKWVVTIGYFSFNQTGICKADYVSTSISDNKNKT